jgi:hypothetical protein
MTYSNRALVRDTTVKFYVSDREKEVIDALVRKTGQQRQVLLRDLVMAAIERALEAESAEEQQ